MKSKIRTFLAVPLEAALRRRVQALVAPWAAVPGDVKWVETENLHLTLKFLGDVDARDLPEVCRVAGQAVAELAPFPFEIHGAGAFPNLQRPRTFWLGARQGREAMVTVADRLDEALRKLGFPRESRRFEPHLTIGRLRQGGRTSPELLALLQQQTDVEIGTMEVSEAIVFSSDLRPTGPVYSVMARLPLTGT